MPDKLVMDLIVDSADPEDRGRGRARIDPDSMQRLNVRPGSLVYIEGRRKTIAKVWRSKVTDWNLAKIRIDNFIRNNAGAGVGDRVRIMPIPENEIIKAENVVLQPPEELSDQLPVNYEAVRRTLTDLPVIREDYIPVQAGFPFMPAEIIPFLVYSTNPENANIITRETVIDFSDTPAEGYGQLRKISYEDIGGLKDELQRVRETIELPLRHPELFNKLGIDPPKGVLLYGPPGTGKTMIARAVANESGANFIYIAGPEVISKYYGESEQKLREVFEEAQDNAPSIIFIDELDSIAPRREDVTGEVERRVVAQLLTMMDGLEERGQVIVIGATNRLDAIDPALRRGGRFDREIEIGVPTEGDRLEVLQIHTRGMPLFSDVDLGEISMETHGFVGADLAALAREAAIKALRRYLPNINLDEDEVPPEILESMVVNGNDFQSALKEVSASAMREVLLEVPHTTWDDIGGLNKAKQEIREAVELPLNEPEKFERLGITPPKGVLLYGPPGTGKTMIARAVANESGANFIPVRGPQLLSKWVGESERAVREVFRKARQVAPSIIFFDELDALTSARGQGEGSHVTESVLNQILTEMDGIEELKDVVIMGATNRPDNVDPALLRSGRFDRLVYIGEADDKEREAIFRVHMRKMPVTGSDYTKMIDLLSPYSEEEIRAVFAGLGEGRTFCYNEFSEQLKTPASGPVVPRNERIKLIEKLLKTQRLRLDDPAREKVIGKMASITRGFVGSDIAGVCREAGILAMREDSEFVSLRHFEEAGKKIHPTMNEQIRHFYSGIEQFFKGGLVQQKGLQLPEYQ